MAREIDLLGYWMPVLRQLKEFKEIAKAETPELKYILEQIERTLNNMFIETADEYGIKRFEDMMGIYPEAGDSLETRRFNVLVKWNDKVPYTEKELYNRLISICGDDNFSVNPDYKNYFLEIITHLGIEGAFDTISSILQDMIPGDDSKMRVLTAYSDRSGKVRMMCLGSILCGYEVSDHKRY